jgi:hypothetical protein
MHEEILDMPDVSEALEQGRAHAHTATAPMGLRRSRDASRGVGSALDGSAHGDADEDLRREHVPVPRSPR